MAYDLVGVGIGPFNLSLAALAEPVAELTTLFLEQRPEFSWHAGLLLEGSRLQIPFLADLVSLIDPTSSWSYLSYLRIHDRLFKFFLSERLLIPRREYDHYCRWVANSLSACRFDSRVTAVNWDSDTELFLIDYCDGQSGQSRRVAGRNVVLGVGTEPAVPEALAGLVGTQVFHSSQYLQHLPSLSGARDVTVVGCGQSGAEVFLDLLGRQKDEGWRLRWIGKSPAFAQKEHSKFGLEHFTPDYARYFHSLPSLTRDRILTHQWQLYKAISTGTLAQIHDLLYERSVGGTALDVMLMPNISVESASPAGDGYQVYCQEILQERSFSFTTDRIILATGYFASRPPLLEPLAGLVQWDDRGRYQVELDYRITLAPEIKSGLFVQNAERHTHGVGSSDLGMGPYRGATILNSVAGREVYRLPRDTAFINFGLL